MAETSKTGLTFTGERFVPGEGGARIAYEHYHRYFFARRLAAKKVVLDLGCGAGYGSNLLAEVADHVTGIDLSPEAVDHARSVYRRANLDFLTGDCRDTRLPERQFDLIVSFEMIEHLAEHDQLLAQVLRLLKSDGVFVVSSPDKEFYSDAEGYENPFHVKELYARDFQVLLERNFSHVALFAQKTCMGSLLWRIHPPDRKSAQQAELIELQPSRDNVFEQVKSPGKSAKYIIGVASEAALDPSILDLQLSAWNDVGETMLRELERCNRELQAAVDHGQTQVRHRDEKIRDQELRIAEHIKALQNAEREITQLNHLISEKEEVLARQETQLQAQASTMTSLEHTNQSLQGFEGRVKGSRLWKAYRLFLRLFPAKRQGTPRER